MILVDSDVFIDIALKRFPFHSDSTDVLNLAIRKEIDICATAIIFSNILYVITKSRDQEAATKFVSNALTFCRFLPNEHLDLVFALASRFRDKEDAINFFTAKRLGVEMIITRNLKDFKEADIPVMTPGQFLLSRAN